LSAAPSASIVAVDVSNPKKAREITAWSSALGPVHALQISDDGNRGYFMVAGMNSGSGDNNGLMIVDTSQIQQRKPHPTIRVISHLFWHDAGEAQIGRVVRIHGHPYVITTDEFGAETTAQQSCAKGQPPYGFVHIIDIGDERHPRLVNTIRLQVNDPANCATVLSEQNAAFSLMYSAHYCTADDPHNTTAIACAWLSSGVRVFDVRDPRHPREIAYYYPPARLDANSIRGGAPYYDLLIGTRTKDATSTQIRWAVDPKTGERELWFISSENGFQVLKLTNGVYPFTTANRTVAPTTATGRTVAGSGAALARTGGNLRAAEAGLAAMVLALLIGAALPRGARRS